MVWRYFMLACWLAGQLAGWPERECGSDSDQPAGLPDCQLAADASRRLEHLRLADLAYFRLVSRRNPIAGDHFVVRLAGADHRVHARVRIDHHFEERRAVELDEFLHD